MWHSTGVPFAPNGRLILLSDGAVLAQEDANHHWWRLSPDSHGDYLNGTWSHAPAMLHQRLWGVSATPLLDGRFLAVGGQGLDPSGGGPAEVLSIGGRLWTGQPALPDWGNFAVVCTLPNGVVLAINFGDDLSIESHDGKLWQWSAASGWSVAADLPADLLGIASLTLLPDGSVLTLGATNAYRYLDGSWTMDGPHHLTPGTGSIPVGLDVGVIAGPVCLLADGRVLAFDAGGAMALRSVDNTWRSAGRLPEQDGMQPWVYAASACLLPSGRILIGVEYVHEVGGVDYEYITYYEWDPKDGPLRVGGAPTDGASNLPSLRSVDLRGMLVLPNGWVMVTRHDIAFYQPEPLPASPSWAPAIDAIGDMGTEHVVLSRFAPPLRLRGRRLTGAGQACYAPFGNANPSNYPLVRLEFPDGRVYYQVTSDHSSLGVGTTEATEYTTFAVTLPRDAPRGPARLCVVVNGIATCLPVTVNPPSQFESDRVDVFWPVRFGLVGGQLWEFTGEVFRPVQPEPPDEGRIRAAHQNILEGLEEMSQSDAANPAIGYYLDRVPGLNKIFSGLRALRALGQKGRSPVRKR